MHIDTTGLILIGAVFVGGILIAYNVGKIVVLRKEIDRRLKKLSGRGDD